MIVFTRNSSKFLLKSAFGIALLSTFLRSIGPVVHAYLLLFSCWEWIAIVEAAALTVFYLIACSGKGLIPDGVVGWVMSLLNIAGTILFFLSLRIIGPLEVTLWLRNQSLFTTLLAIVFLGERHPFIMWLAISLSLLGAFFFSYSSHAGMPSLYNLLLLAGFCISLAVRNLLIKLHPNYSDKELMLQASWLQLVVLIFFVPPLLIEIKLSQICLIALTALLCHGWSTTLFIQAARRSSLSQVTAIRAIGPIITFLIGWMMFPEDWTLLKAAGIILCLSSITIMAFIELRKKEIKIYGSSHIDNVSHRT